MTLFKPAVPVFVGLATLLLSSTAGAVPIVDLIADALDPQACGGQGCWTNHLRVTDFDGDGDLDIILANYNDFFGGGDDPEPLVLYANDGAGGFTNVSGQAVGGALGNFRMVAVGDVDGDGHVDLYLPSGNGDAHVLFINDGSGAFTDEADVRLPIEYPRGGAARMGDVDGDGDLDIVSADGYASNGPPYARLYLNDGAGMFDEADPLPTDVAGEDIDDLELVDVDRDFDLDLVLNAHSGGIGALWLNDGTGSFAAGGNLAPPGPGSQFHYNVTPCDVDGDGDLDLWIDNTGGNYTEQLQINDGNGNFTDETAARVTGNAQGSDDNGVACADVDDDGDLDAIVLALGSPERLLENDGAGNFTLVANGFPGPTNCTLWGEFGDLDGDDRLDLVTGQGECSSSDEVYLGNADMAVDATAPLIGAISDAPDVAVDEGSTLLFAVSDSTVTDEGPRVRGFAVIDPDGAADEVAAKFVGGDLFRVELSNATAGTVTLQLCAEDMAGNVGCSDAITYEVGDGSGDGDGDPTGDGDGDPTGDGDGDPTGDGDGDSGDGDGDPTGEGETGETGGSASDGGDEGCSCTTDSPDRQLGWTVLSLLGLGLVVRRRRG